MDGDAECVFKTGGTERIRYTYEGQLCVLKHTVEMSPVLSAHLQVKLSGACACSNREP